jgi:hypothetical protein
LASDDKPYDVQQSYAKQGIKLGNDANHFKLVRKKQPDAPLNLRVTTSGSFLQSKPTIRILLRDGMRKTMAIAESAEVPRVVEECLRKLKSATLGGSPRGTQEQASDYTLSIVIDGKGKGSVLQC